MKKIPRWLPGALVSLLLIAVILYFVDLGAMVEAVRKANYGLLAIAFVLSIVWMFGRAKVWQTLLRIPLGRATTYSDIAAHLGKPQASRAVGSAVGKNPISFVVPCHRVLGKSGSLCGYHWGLTRKRAILGWEAGVISSGD